MLPTSGSEAEEAVPSPQSPPPIPAAQVSSVPCNEQQPLLAQSHSTQTVHQVHSQSHQTQDTEVTHHHACTTTADTVGSRGAVAVHPSRLPVAMTYRGAGAEVLLPVIVATESALVAKLQWATGELAAMSSVERSTELCRLVKACADALQSTRALRTVPDGP